MKIARVVRSRVAAPDRDAYMATWSELSGTLYTMGIRAELLADRERSGELVELIWFEPGQEASLADDRIVRLDGALTAQAESRLGQLSLHDVR
jgi:hypothetical protein